MGDTRDTDPLIGFMYVLKVDGGTKPTGFFTSVEGIGSESEVIEHKWVDDKGKEQVQKIPGRLKWNPVTLKKGITADITFWPWRQQGVDGKMNDARANCTIIMYDRAGTAVAEWTFDNAWPSKITGPSLKSDSNDYGIEEITIVHEGMKRTK